MKKKLSLFIFLFFPFIANSQTINNLREKIIIINSDTMSIDTLSIIPYSALVMDTANNKIPEIFYFIDYPKSKFIIKTDSLQNLNKIKITYRVFPYDFAKELYHKNPQRIVRSLDNIRNRYKGSELKNKTNDFFSNNKLSKNGSISRGVSFGNNQDVIVDSDLNLQLAGKISENINIVAAISDKNIPIQADGNSQQLQEFDKIYIKLFNETTDLVAGDFELNSENSYFMKINKKSQGALINKKWLFEDNKNYQKFKQDSLKPKFIPGFSTTAGAAISKGKYCKSVFKGTEGNQGPYKLTGCDNEAYIVVLSGSEKIYIDGKLMSRGENNDYVIDYNMAELVFTAKQPITKDKRITIEFEYSDRNYLRYYIYNNNEFNHISKSNKKTNVRLSLYHEQDSKNQTLQQELTDSNKLLMSEIGDSLDKALTPNIDTASFNDDLVLYKLTQKTIDGILFDSIFVHSTNPDDEHYRLGFSLVGSGNGNYDPLQSAINGRVFEWIEPEIREISQGKYEIIPQGSYEPVLLLITPKKQQLLTIGATTELSKTLKADFEIALSNNDINTFSTKDARDNFGYAAKFLLQKDFIFKDTNITCNAIINYLNINKNFTAIENFRSVEFERNWNLSSNNDKETEHFFNASFNYLKKKTSQIIYNIDFMDRENGYRGLKNSIVTKFSKKGYKLLLDGSLLNSSDNINRTAFLRHSAVLSKQIFRTIEIGIKEEQELNKWDNQDTDSLLSNSLKYNQWAIFIKNADTLKNRFSATYMERRDFLPKLNNLTFSSYAKEGNIKIDLTKNTKNSFSASLNYRNLNIIDTSLTDVNAENTIIGRIEHRMKLLKGVIIASTFFETGSGLEAKKEFSYLEIANGQGIYKWVDYNDNSIKELNEFEISNFQDEANYIRILAPTTDYIKTYTNQFSHTINIKPYKIWRKKKDFRKILSRFSDNFAFRINPKSQENGLMSLFNSDADEIVSIASSLRNTVSFNRPTSKFGINYIIKSQKNKILMTNGYETRTNKSQLIKFKLKIGKHFTIFNESTQGQKIFDSEYFASKNYNINYIENNISLSFSPNTSLKTDLKYKYNQKQNLNSVQSTENINELSTTHNLGIELQYKVLKKASIAVKGDYIKIDYNAPTTTPIAYTMLEGFNPGNNASWSFILQKSLSSGLILNITYNGRVSENSDVVHTGGLQLRANF